MIGTVAGWITYAAERGTTIEDNAASSAALVRASDYIELNYVQNFASGYDATSPGVEQAAYIAAALELASPGALSKTTDPSTLGKVLTKVDSIQWTVPAGAIPSRTEARSAPVNSTIEALLRKYMGGSAVGGLGMVVV